MSIDAKIHRETRQKDSNAMSWSLDERNRRRERPKTNIGRILEHTQNSYIRKGLSKERESGKLIRLNQ